MPPKEQEATCAELCPAEVSVGLLGCGTIASAVATGIARQERIPISRISVSRRSRSKSEALAKEFPSLVTVHDDNQQIVDRSDVVFVCVLPAQANEVVKDLTFREGQKLVSIVATASLDDLSRHSGVLPTDTAKMICTPSIALHEGVSLLYPPQKKDSILTRLCDSMGGSVQCQSNEEMTALMSGMCVMGPMYGLLKTHVEWLVSQGIRKKDASFLVGKQYQAIIKDVERQCDNPDCLDELIDEQTPGGINRLALGQLDSLGGLRSYNKVLDAIVDCIDGTTDGDKRGHKS
mmetsp:Transcript_35987/g.86632  ORF Transcript_35987/g.86632 Transcript_35987/m.86632 type:complete len:291 (-) Transcript_35987:333-1205(-)